MDLKNLFVLITAFFAVSAFAQTVHIQAVDEASIRSQIQNKISLPQLKNYGTQKSNDVIDLREQLNSLDKKFIQFQTAPKIKSLEKSGTGGGMDGAGGGGRSLHFLKIAQDIRAMTIKLDHTKQFSMALDMAIHNTEIEFVNERLFLNGVRKDALNFASLNKIKVDENAWESLSYEQKVILVIHEYLGIMGIDDQRAQISQYFYRESSRTQSSYNNVKAEEGTEIAFYDELRNSFNALGFKSEFNGKKQELMISILKIFYGFDQIVFKNNNVKLEMTNADWLTTSLRFFLPYDPNTQAFIALNGKYLRTQTDQEVPVPHTSGRKVLIFDGSSQAIEYKEDVRANTCTLKLGHNIAFADTIQKMGLYMVLLRNCNRVHEALPDINQIKKLDGN